MNTLEDYRADQEATDIIEREQRLASKFSFRVSRPSEDNTVEVKTDYDLLPVIKY